MYNESDAYYYMIGWMKESLNQGKRTVDIKHMVQMAYKATGCQVSSPELFGISNSSDESVKGDETGK